MASQSAPKYRDVEVTFTAPKSSSTSTASIHYVEAGDSSKPKVVLLHGFPCSSHQFRSLIPLIADNFHVLAPDYPGFGLSTAGEGYTYNFENITVVMAAWLKQIGVTEAAVYIQDFGAPVGMRLAITGGLKLTAIVSQNGNVYHEGLGLDFFKPLLSWWETGDAEIAKAISQALCTLEGAKDHITVGTPEQDMILIDPKTWHLAYLQNLAGEEKTKNMMSYLFDYQTNPPLYKEQQKYIRDNKVPVLAAWGKGDPAFIYPGAGAFKTDSPDAEVHLLDAGHMALETKHVEIAELMNAFLKKTLK